VAAILPSLPLRTSRSHGSTGRPASPSFLRFGITTTGGAVAGGDREAEARAVPSAFGMMVAVSGNCAVEVVLRHGAAMAANI
jgi:hypothetical protein